MNIRKWTGIVLAVMLLSTAFTAGAATFTPGDYEASAQGFGGTVSVKLTVDEEAITAIEITGEGETPALGGAAIEQMSAAYVDRPTPRAWTAWPARPSPATPVSYTHLDVYKRQAGSPWKRCGRPCPILSSSLTCFAPCGAGRA